MDEVDAVVVVIEMAVEAASMLQVKAADVGATIRMVPAAKSVKFDEEPGATREAQFSSLL